MVQYNDHIRLIKKDGTVIENIPASCQPGLIFIEDEKTPIEEGDNIERELPSGVVEHLVITDPGYYGHHSGFPAYQVKVKPESQVKKQIPSQIIYNINGHNAKVNIDSIDQSYNYINTDTNDIFKKLIELINDQVTDNSNLLSCVLAMKQDVGKPSFVEKYQNFIAAAANHITLLAPFIPALTQMIP